MTLQKEQRGAAESLLDLVLNSSDHLWHNRPGIDRDGVWRPTRWRGRPTPGTRVRPGLFVPAAVRLYQRLLDIHQLDAELAARFASYALTQTDWRDLKVCCAALMLVQPRAGRPVFDDDGTVGFHDDDYRAVGEAMILHYQQGSTRMMNPKSVLRVAQLLETPQIAAMNRSAGFADPAGRKPPLGRWRSAARQWLAHREANPPLLDGLVNAGYKETIKQLARKCGYRPASEQFYVTLGWPQKQAADGHRRIGLDGLRLRRQERFDGMTEEQICERIVDERIGFKDAMGRLPAGIGLTPAIMVALLPTLSDRDLRILSPTLESLGLLADAEIFARWEKALATATDLRSVNVARNLRSGQLRDHLEGAAEAAITSTVTETAADDQLHVMFLIDTSASMQGAIERSVDALVRIFAGFPPDRLHIAAFDTTGKVLRPKANTRAGVRHMLAPLTASGGTTYGAAIQAFRREGVRLPRDARLIVIAIGDEAGENGVSFGLTFMECEYAPAAMALIVNVATDGDWIRGRTVRDAAAELAVPFSEIQVEQFDDPYQVPRVLKALLDAPVPTAGAPRARAAQVFGWVEKVLATPLLEKPPR